MNTTYRPDPVPIDAPGEPAVRLIPLGGLGEIGLNMMLIECGPDILAVDCGLLFPDDEMPGVDFAIPDFAYLRERRDAFRGVVLTHGHEDHIGALSYLLREFPVPVYGTPLTLAVAKHRLAEHGVLDQADLRDVRAGRSPRHRRLHGGADPRDPLDRRRHRPRDRDAARHRGPHRRLQARPEAGGSPAAGLLALRGAGRARRARALLGLDQRRPAGAHRLRDARGRGARGPLRGGAGAHHPRHLRLAHPPHPAGARSGGAAAIGTSRCSARA